MASSPHRTSASACQFPSPEANKLSVSCGQFQKPRAFTNTCASLFSLAQVLAAPDPLHLAVAAAVLQTHSRISWSLVGSKSVLLVDCLSLSGPICPTIALGTRRGACEWMGALQAPEGHRQRTLLSSGPGPLQADSLFSRLSGLWVRGLLLPSEFSAPFPSCSPGLPLLLPL